MKRTPKSQGPVKTFIAMPEDLRIMGELKEILERRHGKMTDTSLFRMGLRKLAESEGINLVQP